MHSFDGLAGCVAARLMAWMNRDMEGRLWRNSDPRPAQMCLP